MSFRMENLKYIFLKLHILLRVFQMELSLLYVGRPRLIRNHLFQPFVCPMPMRIYKLKACSSLAKVHNFCAFIGSTLAGAVTAGLPLLFKPAKVYTCSGFRSF